MEKQAVKLCAEGKLKSFYLDRFLRIFPLYLIVLLLVTPFFEGTARQYLENLLLIPLNYTTFTGTPIAIGPTWSLACEAQFYILVPFLYRLPGRWLKAISLLSLGLFSVSPLLPNSTFWAYTGLPGILFVFCTGMLISRSDLGFPRFAWTYAWPLLIVFLALKMRHFDLPSGININILVGFLLFLPIVFVLSKLSPKNELDRILGLLSYPVFLCHEPTHAYVSRYLNIDNPILLLLLSVIVGTLLVVFVELPFDRVRYGVRKLHMKRAEYLT